MAAQIPIKNDPKANDDALGKVRADKDRESVDGHDGTWVAHPGLVALAKESFDASMPGPNQIDNTRDDVHVTAKDLLTVPQGDITEAGLRHNINVGILYMAAWLAGSGCVPIYNLMEDAATAEISRSQIWQWIHHTNGVFADGRKVTVDFCHSMFDEEMLKIRDLVGDTQFSSGHYIKARELIEGIVTSDHFAEFMTITGYDHLE
jgi:malate synthase